MYTRFIILLGSRKHSLAVLTAKAFNRFIISNLLTGIKNKQINLLKLNMEI
jgi:hypothetical protein